MNTTPHPDHIFAFRAVMQHGSLSAAARVLGLAQPTLRRHVEALEASLDTRLFTRAQNGLTPTAVAYDLRPIADAMAAQADAFGRAASAAQARAGTVRLTTSRVLATHVLPALLADLRQAEPDIRIELAATDTSENLLHRAADIAIRLAPVTQAALVVRRLPDIALGLYATPDFARQHGAEPLAEIPFISDDRTRQIEPGLASLGLPEPHNIVLRTDDALTQIAAIRAGVGTGFCQCAIAARLGLARLFAELETTLPCSLVMHEDLARTPRIRAVFDHLAGALPARLRAPPGAP